ncbi:MAG: sulfite dehydrogenase, partial [Haliea sp.]
MLSRSIQRAPENFLDPAQIREVRAGRRGFLAGALSAAALAAGTARAQSAGPAGAREILELPPHS